MEHLHARKQKSSPARTWPEFHQLAMFLDVVVTGSFAATARRNGCTQPAISQAIARLEDLFGGDLFERRRGAPLTLTPIGEAVLPSARILLDTVDDQVRRATETAQSRAGGLSLGFSSSLAGGPLRAGLMAFVEERPRVHLRLIEGTSHILRRSLTERHVDLLIVAAMPDALEGTLSRERLWEERLFLALPKDHPLSAGDARHWRSASALPLLNSAANPEFRLSVGCSNQIAPLPLRQEEHAVSRSALLDMVGLGLGMTVVIGSAISPHPGVVFRPLIDENATVPIDAIWRTHDRNPLRHHLLGDIRAHRAAWCHEKEFFSVTSTMAPTRDPG